MRRDCEDVDGVNASNRSSSSMRRDYEAELPVGSPRCGHQTCGRVFANRTLFDQHVAGEVRGVCPDPKRAGLELREGVWGTVEGNAHAEALTERLTQVRGATRKPRGTRSTREAA